MGQIDFIFILNSILLGVGLAMDAFSVSIVNGLSEPKMKPAKMSIIAGCYAFFQFAMPMIGWFVVNFLMEVFSVLEKLIPWIAFVLLILIGGKMIWESAREIIKCRRDKKAGKPCEKEDKPVKKLTAVVLFIQGIATSIDALSVGLTIAEYKTAAALIAAGIISVVTFIICMVGLKIGKFAGKHLGDYAGLLGGIILVGIGLEILIRGLFF